MASYFIETKTLFSDIETLDKNHNNGKNVFRTSNFLFIQLQIMSFKIIRKLGSRWLLQPHPPWGPDFDFIFWPMWWRAYD